MFQTKVVDEIETNILCSVSFFFFFFTKLCRFCDLIKCGRARQATDNNKMLQRKGAVCTSDTKGKK